MSVSSEQNKVRYACNGSNKTFSVPFVFFDSTDIVVLLVDSSGGETTLTLNVEYTISGGSGSTGTVTTTTAYGSTYTICIWRHVPVTQTLDLVEGGAFTAASIENALDKATQISQDIYNRVMVLKRGGSLSGPIEVPTFTASSVLGINSAGTAFQFYPTTNIDTVDFDKLSNYASLAAAVSSIGSTKKTLLIDADSTVATDTTVPKTLTLWFKDGAILTVSSGKTLIVNGQIQAPASAQVFAGAGTITLNNYQWVTPQWFGAVCDGVTDDSTAFNNALASTAPVIMTTGTYALNARVKIPSNGVLKGQGQATILKKGLTFTAEVGVDQGWITNSDWTNGNTNIYIGDFAISNPVYNASYLGGIRFKKVEGFLVENINTSTWNDESPIQFVQGCRYGEIRGCRITHASTSATTPAMLISSGSVHTVGSSSTHISVIDNYLVSYAVEAFAIDSPENAAAHMIVQGNVFRAMTAANYYAVRLGNPDNDAGKDGTCLNIIFSDNYIAGRTLIHKGCDTINFNGNNIYYEFNGNIEAVKIATIGASGSPAPRSINVFGNMIKFDGAAGAAKYGIYLSHKDTGYMRITNNTVLNSGAESIYCTGVDTLAVDGNYVSPLAGVANGILFVDCTDVSVAGNYVDSTPMNGIASAYSSVDMQKIQVRNNTVTGATTWAITMNPAGSATAYNIVIQGNIMYADGGVSMGGIGAGPDWAGSILSDNVYVGSGTAYSMGTNALTYVKKYDNLKGTTVANINYPLRLGDTGSRPTLGAIDRTFTYLDTTLGYPIWWNGAAWIRYDGTGV